MRMFPIEPRAWVPDIEDEVLPAESFGGLLNMRPKDGLYEQAEPYAQVMGTLDGATGPRYLLPNQDGSVAYWIYAKDTGVFVTDGTTHTNISPAGLTDITALTAPWTGGIVNQLPVMNSRVDGPYWWDQNTLNNLTALPDWTAGDTCNAMRSFRGYLIAMNIVRAGVRYEDVLAWSDIAAPGAIPQSWTAGVNSQAGEVSVSFNPGGLVDGRQLGDRFFVYKTSSCYLLQLIGGQFIFSQRPVFATVGALSRNCIEEFRGTHIVLTDGDLVAHDGTTVRSLVDKKARRRIFDDLDGDNYENSYLALDRDAGRLYVARPKVGEIYPSEMLELDLTTGEFGRRDNATAVPFAVSGLVDKAGVAVESTWDQKTTTWATDPTRWNDTGFQRTADFMVLADHTRNALQQLGSGSKMGDVGIVGRVLRQSISFGDETRVKRVGRVYPRIVGSLGAQVQITVGAQQSPDQGPAWAPEQTFTVGQTKSLNFDKDDVTGYYLAYRVRSSDQLPWKLNRLNMEVHDMGAW